MEGMVEIAKVQGKSEADKARLEAAQLRLEQEEKCNEQKMRTMEGKVELAKAQGKSEADKVRLEAAQLRLEQEEKCNKEKMRTMEEKVELAKAQGQLESKDLLVKCHADQLLSCQQNFAMLMDRDDRKNDKSLSVLMEFAKMNADIMKTAFTSNKG
jgi:hypothetical protein